MATSSYQANATFDAYSQPFTLLAPDGTTPIDAFVSDIAILQTNAITQAIVYGIQIGLTGMLLLVLMLLTKSDKRRGLVFILNSGALLFLLIRNIVATLELRSLFYNFYNWELAWYPETSALHRAMAASLTTEIFNVLIDAIIYASLIVQVHIVCCTIGPLQRRLVDAGGCILAGTAVAVRTTLAVCNGKWLILGLNTATERQYRICQRLSSAQNIILVISVALFSTVFVVKLAFAIALRRKLKMSQLGPMQIVFIMGCQTLFIPLIFAIITYFVTPGAQINSFVQTIVAIFLPLSGMWAGANTTQRTPANGPRRVLPVGGSDIADGRSFGPASSSAYDSKLQTAATNSTLVGTLDFEKRNNSTTSEVADVDVEMQRLNRGGAAGVSMGQPWSVIRD